MQILDKSGSAITSVNEWTRPKEDYHWKPGRSAQELARAWFRIDSPAPPHELIDLLNSHPLTRGALLDRAIPEFVTSLPYRGEGRNHDLWVTGSKPECTFGIGIEAKADEPFGDTLSEYLRRKRSSDTRAPDRLARLLKGLFGPDADGTKPPWANLRHQLVTGIAGTLIQAKRDGTDVACFIVHEFLGDGVDRAEKVPANHRDFIRFTGLLIGDEDIHLVPGHFVGPIQVPGNEDVPADVELVFGKIVSELGVDSS